MNDFIGFVNLFGVIKLFDGIYFIFVGGVEVYLSNFLVFVVMEQLVVQFCVNYDVIVFDIFFVGVFQDVIIIS